MSADYKINSVEREIQYVNFSFGAAFGGYIGVILATRELSNIDIYNLMFILLSTGFWLAHFHDVALAVMTSGIKKNAWAINLSITMIVGLQLLSSLLPSAYTIATRLFQFWGAALFLSLFLTAFRLRKRSD